MIKFCILVGALLLALVMIGAIPQRVFADLTNIETSFTLSSPQLEDGGILPLKSVYHQNGCHGQNFSPALHWSNVPKGTKSFAVTVFDPDASTESGWWHWLLYNIPATAKGLKSNVTRRTESLPIGARESFNDFGHIGYDGACPPVGDGPHRYIFTVYALSVKTLVVPNHTTPTGLVSQIRQHMLAKATLTVFYQR